ncbi:thiamine phosphate synthase [Candidatus Woesearchaeota archaeon]|nr:thiamine phosphate synthase [Candidatus Woesearchaeota archaeon]
MNKKHILNDMDLYFITHRPYYDVIQSVKIALKAGVKIIQYREKERDYPQLIETAQEIRKLTKQANALFIVNDYLDLAVKVDADGVHLGQEDGTIKQARIQFPDMIIGRSTHNLKQAIEAEHQGADYIGIGPIYATVTHQNPEPVVGIPLLKQIRANVKIPIVAIGGITKERVSEILSTGTTSMAILQGILTKQDIGKEIREIRTLIQQGKVLA